MNRFTDTEKWQPWFRKLPNEYKVLWVFLCDACDPAGVWERDQESANFFIGQSIDLDLGLSMINDGKERIRVFSNGRKWLLADFISYQYHKLIPGNKVYSPVYRSLEKHGLDPKKYEIRGSADPLQSPQDKTRQEREYVVSGLKRKEWFEEIWAQYPNKAGKSKAEERFTKTVKTPGDLQAIREGLSRYLKHLAVNTWKHAQNGATWFGSWKDWLDFNEPEGREDAKSKSKRLLDEIAS